MVATEEEVMIKRVKVVSVEMSEKYELTCKVTLSDGEMVAVCDGIPYWSTDNEDFDMLFDEWVVEAERLSEGYECWYV